MQEKLIPLSEDVEKTSQDIRETMYQNLLSKGVNGITPSMDVEALAKLILTVPDRSGLNGWTLVPAIAIDGERCVFKLAGWLLNDGNPPPSNMYLGYTGLVNDIKDGINIRGRDGLTTQVTINGRAYTQANGNISLPDLLPVSHNTSTTAHEDLRNIVAGIQALLESDDTALDELQEIIAYIKDNRDLLGVVTTQKVGFADIVDSLDSTDSKKPLSANMGRVLKAMAEAKQDKGDYATNTEVDRKISDIKLPDVAGAIGTHNTSTGSHNDIRLLIGGLDNAKQDKGDYATNATVDQKIANMELPDVGGTVGVHNTSSTAHNDIRTLISGKQDKGNYVLTTDARLADARNAKDVQAWAKAATKPAYTASEVGLGNVNNTADADKPVSTATQAALDLKANAQSPAFTGNMALTGNLTLKGSGNFGNKINFGDGDYVHISEPADDTLELKGTRIKLYSGSTEVLKIEGGKAYVNGVEINSKSMTADFDVLINSKGIACVTTQNGESFTETITNIATAKKIATRTTTRLANGFSEVVTFYKDDGVTVKETRTKTITKTSTGYQERVV